MFCFSQSLVLVLPVGSWEWPLQFSGADPQAVPVLSLFSISYPQAPAPQGLISISSNTLDSSGQRLQSPMKYQESRLHVRVALAGLGGRGMREEAAGGIEGFSEILHPNAPGRNLGAG